MIGILLVTHASLGEALIAGAAHVMGGPPVRVRAISVIATDSPEKIRDEARAAAAVVDDGSGVLVISDMCGGTPCNVATRLGVPGRVEVICGASLPMLVRALTYRNEPLESVVKKALSGGNEGVMKLSGGAADAAGRG
jgi:mannose PTS system EIIA component